MIGKLFLSGGGDEKQTFEVDEIFLKGIEKILYIPLAWKNNDFESCKKWFTNAMQQHKKIDMEMLTNLTKSPNLNNYDAVYIGGGNTFKLLKKIRDSKFDRKLIQYYNNGGIIYGGSAGAIILGKDINIALICGDKDINNVNLKNTRGFDKVKGHDIQCHYNDSHLREHQEFIKKTKRNVVAIPEESALLIGKGTYEVIGLKPITVISQNASKKFKPKTNISLEF